MNKLRYALYAIAAIAIASANATTVIAPDFDRLVGDAELIFQGAVTDVKSQWIGEGAERRIVSYVTFKVEEPIKGNPGSTYTIRMLGGTVDGQTLEVTDAPKFKNGDREILFVEHNGSQFIPLVGIMHGRFHVKRDESGREVLITGKGRPLADVAELGKEESAPSAKAALSVQDFKAAIKTKLAQAQPDARHQ
jgi:hypothetical protein